ncbi:subtilisin-like protease 4 [Zingiber officinale]|uniref:subtilisin-like protease 4 n=1 Tax=Zingiber officinale TaxID=94328 RepID=UPI001C4D9F07|nr:subtilisin-like protease 4 [Zingiber officinale]
METHSAPSALFLLLAVSSFLLTASSPQYSQLQSYIIRMRLPRNATLVSAQALDDWYRSLLPPTAANSTEPRILYTYSAAMTGFAARLTEEELRSVERKPGFLASFRDRQVPLLTTYTPRLLGLLPGLGLWTHSNMGKGIVIGVLDTGLVDHASFADQGMDPPPAHWRGSCAPGLQGAISCNNKLIGAQSFVKNESPVDTIGHGTHTASTAAGNFVAGANVLGNANGTASGIAPRAHLAIYKVCGRFDCTVSSITAGMEAAIKDGVDVMSLSLGGGPIAFYDDVIAIGAFSAVERGIFVSCAGGNSGPMATSLSNEAPWVLTVAASTIDRNIRATVRLGNGVELDGESAYQPNSYPSDSLPMTIPDGSLDGPNCWQGLVEAEVKGKMVICSIESGSSILIGDNIKSLGGLAMLMVNGELDGYTTMAEAPNLPMSYLNYINGSSVAHYVNATQTPVASIIFKGTVFKVFPAPTVAYFSSRGPNSQSRAVLKPDILGPGVNILAAWPIQVGPKSSQTTGNTQTTFFNMISGTSMSTPHLSGVAALIKAAHPDWSPAAVKSAIMTTSDITDEDGNPIKDEQHNKASFLGMGAGNVNPSKATDPGLVYDIEPNDYVRFLCGLGYSDKQVEVVTHRKVTCTEVGKIREVDLNYPAIILASSSDFDKITVIRTVKNVCSEKSTYKSKVDGLESVAVEVLPETLDFSGKINESKSFNISFSKKITHPPTQEEGHLLWISDTKSVRIPILILV